MPNEVQALTRRKELQRDRDELDHLVEVARSRGPQKRFQLRKCQFDRIEIRTVRRKEPEARARPFNGRRDFRLLMHGEVVEDDDVAGLERWHEHLLDIGEKRGIVDGPVEDGWRVQAVDAQRRDHGVRLPMAIGRVVTQSESAWAAAVATDQIGRDTGFVDEDVPACIVQRERVLPSPPRRGDISAPLFVGEDRFF